MYVIVYVIVYVIQNDIAVHLHWCYVIVYVIQNDIAVHLHHVKFSDFFSNQN